MAKNKEKIIGYNTKNKNVINSVGDYYLPNSGIVFKRDVEQLYTQYENFRKSIGKLYSKQIINSSDKEEIFGALDEIWVNSVLEYDISSYIDFAGLPNSLIKTRLRGSFLSKYLRNHQRETTLKSDDIDTGYILDKQTELGINHQVSLRKNKKEKQGYESKITAYQNDNEIDDSLLVLTDYLKSEGVYNDITKTLIHCFVRNEKSAKETCAMVSKELDIPLDKVTKEYAKLENALIHYINPND